MEEAEKLEKERREKVKTDIVTKKQFAPSKLFKPIYKKRTKRGTVQSHRQAGPNHQ